MKNFFRLNLIPNDCCVNELTESEVLGLSDWTDIQQSAIQHFFFTKRLIEKTDNPTIKFATEEDLMVHLKDIIIKYYVELLDIEGHMQVMWYDIIDLPKPGDNPFKKLQEYYDDLSEAVEHC